MAAWHTCGVAMLLVANAGGHLEELYQLAPRFVAPRTEVVWVTQDTPQSRALLAGEQRLFAPPAPPRDAGATLAVLRFARRVLASAEWTDVVSTGSLTAVPFLTLARSQGVRCHFVESVARVMGPSLSAKILERVPGVRCYSPYRWWRRPGWRYRGSVLDGYAAVPAGTRGTELGTRKIRRVVVTLGTSGFGFRRVLLRLREVLPDDCEVYWQTGSTDVAGLGIEAHAMVEAPELASRMAEADLVVAHAGAGSVLAAMRAGRSPLLVPRLARYGEHVDDHQVEICREMERRGLAVSCDAGAIDGHVLLEAAARTVRAAPHPPPFELDDVDPGLVRASRKPWRLSA